MLRKNVAGQKVHFSLFKSGARIANPTIAVGDFTVDIDNAGQGNVATPPTSDAAGLVTWLPSQAETNGTYITLLANDVAGAEWEPLSIEFDTRLADIVAAELATYDAPTKSELDSGLAGLNDLSAAEINAQVDTALSDYDAPTKAELDSGLAAIPAAVWAYATRTLSSISALLSGISADMWGYSSRTLTQSAASVTTAVTGSNITVMRGDYWSISLTGLGSLVGRTKLYFTVKKSRTDTDAESIIQIEETAGLVYLNGAAAGTPTNGSLTVTDETTGAATIVLKAAETDDLEPSELVYDVQMVDATGPTTKSDGGTFTVTADVTRRIT